MRMRAASNGLEWKDLSAASGWGWLPPVHRRKQELGSQGLPQRHVHHQRARLSGVWKFTVYLRCARCCQHFREVQFSFRLPCRIALCHGRFTGRALLGCLCACTCFRMNVGPKRHADKNDMRRSTVRWRPSFDLSEWSGMGILVHVAHE